MNNDQTPTTLMSLPTELISFLLKFISIKDAINFGRVNKYFRKIYLENVRSAKYISNKIEPNTNVALFNEAILENVRLGNRILVICQENKPTDNSADEPVDEPADEPKNDIYKIVNITSLPDRSKNLTLHLINNDNTQIEIVCLNIDYNIIVAKIATNFMISEVIIKLLTESPFQHKMRPLNVRFSKKDKTLVWK